jgi:hypothetical protein
MTCPDFENKVYLYLSGELNLTEKNDFKSHLKSCDSCEKEFKRIQETWLTFDQLPQENPNPEIRKVILKQARITTVKTSPLKRLAASFSEWIIPRKYVWGISTVAIAALLLFFIIQPFGQKREDQLIQTDLLSWEDDFFAQAELISSEIDRMQSGQFIATYNFAEEDPIEFEETLSPMSDDLNWIREQVENLMRTIYGI